MKHRVIIIGAGASGLFAAMQLAGDCEVIILEAAAQAGGRIQTIPLQGGKGVIECGAEFVHGNLPITDSLIKAAALTKVPVSGKMYRSEDGKLHRETEMIEGWNELMGRMKHQPDEMTMQTFLDYYYLSPKYDELRAHARSYVHGFDLAPLSNVTVSSLYEEWSAEEEQYFLKEGYSSVVQYMCSELEKKNAELKLNSTATSISWQKGRVEVSTSDGNKYHANHILVTVPVSILANSNLLQFVPAIPAYREAAADIGFGPVVKTVIGFTEKFWKKDLSFVFSQEAIPTWWSHHPIDDHLLTGWVGGPDAAKIYHLADDELLHIAYSSLSNIFNVATADLRANTNTAHVFNWIKNTSCLGAYSYTSPKTPQAQQILQEPIEGTLFFAGEGLVAGPHPGTVEAALTSGMRAADQIRKHIPI